jgi:hypothetical protein
MVTIASITRTCSGNMHTIKMSSVSCVFTMNFTAHPKNRVKLRIGIVWSNTTTTYIQATFTTLREIPSLPPSCQYHPMLTLQLPATPCTPYKQTLSQASYFLLSSASNLSDPTFLPFITFNFLIVSCNISSTINPPRIFICILIIIIFVNCRVKKS